MRILVVEDDSALREDLRQQFAAKGFGVDIAADGEDGLAAGLAYSIDVAIVDLGLPRQDGVSIIRYWRGAGRTFPVVILTARDSWRDKVHGLAAGADDYVCKPFVFEELDARVGAVMRRATGWATPELVCGPYVLHTRERMLTVESVAVELTSYEYRLLEHLMLHAGEPLSTVELAEHLYEEGHERDSNVVTQLIFRIRRKIDPLNRFSPIETMRQGGYRFAIPRGPWARSERVAADRDVERLDRQAPWTAGPIAIDGQCLQMAGHGGIKIRG
jgi:two-component system response regulator PhoP